MARTSSPTDPWSTFVGLLADALAARLDFPPRPSSAAFVRVVPARTARARAGARQRGRAPAPALVARLTEELLEALAARADFPPRASSAALALAAAPRAAAARSGVRRKGPRRSPARLARLTEEIRAHVASHPGERIGQIGSALRRSPRDLALPVRRLLAEGKLEARGARGAARYYPA